MTDQGANTEKADAARGARFPRSCKLCHDLEYQAVYDARMKKAAGPLLMFTRPNGLRRWRLGLAVGKRVGTAVQRNRVKRMVREAFRLIQHDLPGAYDLVVSPRQNPELPLADYQRLIAQTAELMHKDWSRREKRDGQR
ncbi:MAG: ribonuclease P protein component [Planctomycetes bacterium]|nr:ribonuclease P protein component [Planctomycetota bacterium]